MEYLIYISTAKKLLDTKELTDILHVSRRNNKQHHITGVLLYSEGTFIQLLEGEPESVNIVYDLIVRDSRHKNIIKLIHTSTDKRSFPDWTMGFKIININDMGALEGYFNPQKHIITNNDNHPGVAMIKTFADNNMYY
ncbi:BLUF domain-containing protein [Mucilaginibacter mali]|uniref:BLUF domain-containing protein n=1 Tax=Mucilaginibacter mali TaxID=2740462 RepID=A0A7D4PTU4_9SPHI|nr:BLUF domain-containing protein [Mucilaginibacter mali]QKJ29983.1 BLUF domain-containing protein [Mucilaginibacter mali]